jgi:hypothetical protein
MLMDMVGKLQNPKVGFVHQLPYTTDEPGFAAAVEKVRHYDHNMNNVT